MALHPKRFRFAISSAERETRPIHIAVDAHDLARDERGIGRYARAVVARLASRADVELTLLVRDPMPFRFASSLHAAVGAGGLRVANWVSRAVDVVWHPWNGTFFSAAQPAVATIHDVAPFAFPAVDPKRRAAQQGPIRLSAQHSRAIICDSHFAAREIERHLNVERERLHVVPLGVEAHFAPGPAGVLPARLRGRRYVLHVGAHDDHKNLATLVSAYRTAFAGEDVALVLTRPNPLVPEAIVCAGIDDQALVALYRGAAAVALPSLYEGFGLPMLEALGCGAPVVASRSGSLPEAGGDAAVYVDRPMDAAAWSAALRATVFGERDPARAERGVAWARSFTWDACLERTLAVVRSALAK
jgi:glycosyltransferase involved in cell wall biosynthesis